MRTVKQRSTTTSGQLVTYVGRRQNGYEVTVLVGTLAGRPLRPRNDLCNHSPTGFAWGYAGSGPAQLALAIVADHLSRNPDDLIVARRIALRPAVGNGGVPTLPESNADALALHIHQQFKAAVIAPLDQSRGFVLDSREVSTALRKLAARGGGR